MPDINRVMLLGRLGGDPVLRTAKTGTQFVTFNMATETWIKSKNEAETTWHRVIAWGNPAQKCSDELKKGMSVLIEGKMKVRKYEDESGKTNYMHEVHVDKVNFLHKKHPVPQMALSADDVEIDLDGTISPEEITH